MRTGNKTKFGKILGMAAGVAMLAAPAQADGPYAGIEEGLDSLPFSIGGDIGVVTKYIFRAQSALGNGGASVQGSLSLSPDFLEQLSLGVWYSTIDGTSGGDEIDFTADFTQEITDMVSVSAGVVAYTFVNAGSSTAVDLYGGLGAGPISTTLYYTVSGDDTAAVLADDDIWWEVALDLPAVKGITPSVTAQLAQYGEATVGEAIENDDFQLAAVLFGLSKDVNDWVSVNLNYSVGVGEDRNDHGIKNEFWAGFFLSF